MKEELHGGSTGILLLLGTLEATKAAICEVMVPHHRISWEVRMVEFVFKVIFLTSIRKLRARF